MDLARIFAAVRTSVFGGALSQNQVNGITPFSMPGRPAQ